MSAGWEPSSEAAIARVIADGGFDENHHLDGKREIGETPGRRMELARVLASFAIDGGAVLIGVGEDKPNRAWSLAPFDLAGQAERVDEIASNLVDPALFVEVRPIPSEQSPGMGYLWVDVPPSPHAPHMVGGAYYARADRTRRRLTDAEVVRLHARRDSADAITGRLLDEEIARDPLHVDRQRTGHLYAVAWPISGSPDLAVELIRDTGTRLRGDLTLSSEAAVSARLRGIPPTPSDAGVQTRRANGVSWTNMSETGARTVGAQHREARMLDIELRRDGGLRLLVGGCVEDARIEYPLDVDPDRGRAVRDGLIVAYAHRLLRWAEHVSTACSYRGTWGLGVAVTHLEHAMSSLYYQDIDIVLRPTPYDERSYREMTTAAGAELVTQPWAVADRLVGRLLATLGTAGHYEPELTPPATPER